MLKKIPRIWNNSSIYARYFVIVLLCAVFIFTGLAKVEYWNRWSKRNVDFNVLKQSAYNLSNTKNIKELNAPGIENYEFTIKDSDTIVLNIFESKSKHIIVEYSKDYGIKSIKTYACTAGDIIITIIISILLGMIATIGLYILYIMFHSIRISIKR